MPGVAKERVFEAAGKITLIYLLFGAAWVAGTNKLVEMWVKDPAMILPWQTYKGWLFVAFTGVILFFLIKNEERRVRELEHRSKILLRAIPDIVFRFNIDGVFVDYSVEDERSLALPPEQFLGKNIAEVLPQDIALPMMEAVRKALETGKVQTFEYQIETPKGLMFSEARVVAEGADVVAFVRDVTERGRYMETLKDSEQKFSQIFKDVPEVMILASLDKAVFWEVNEAFVTELGYERGEVLAKSMFEINVWEDEVKGNNLLRELKEIGVVKNREINLRSKTGKLINLYCSVTVMNLGGVAGFLLLGMSRAGGLSAEDLMR